MILQSEQLNELAAALAKAQAEIKNPEKRKTAKAGSYSYKYADIADGLSGILPILSKHGISVVQPTSLDGGVIMLHTRLMHSSGQWIEGVYPVCPPGKHQDMGGAMTYSRRYALFSMVGVAGEDDIDGVDASDSAAPKKDNRAATAHIEPEKLVKSGEGLREYKALQAEIRALVTVEKLNAWGITEAWRIHRLPDDWQSFIRDCWHHRKTELEEFVTEEGKVIEPPSKLKKDLKASLALHPLEAGE